MKKRKKMKKATKTEIIKDVSIAVGAAVAGALAAYEWEKYGLTKKTKNAVKKDVRKVKNAAKKVGSKAKKAVGKAKKTVKKAVRRKK
ncbi:MAG: hypothetical protein ABIE94_02665 [archaeon]